MCPEIIWKGGINTRKNLVQGSESKDDERYDNFIIAKKQEQLFLEKQNRN